MFDLVVLQCKTLDAVRFIVAIVALVTMLVVHIVHVVIILYDIYLLGIKLTSRSSVDAESSDSVISTSPDDAVER